MSKQKYILDCPTLTFEQYGFLLLTPSLKYIFKIVFFNVWRSSGQMKHVESETENNFQSTSGKFSDEVENC